MMRPLRFGNHQIIYILLLCRPSIMELGGRTGKVCLFNTGQDHDEVIRIANE